MGSLAYLKNLENSDIDIVVNDINVVVIDIIYSDVVVFLHLFKQETFRDLSFLGGPFMWKCFHKQLWEQNFVLISCRQVSK